MTIAARSCRSLALGLVLVLSVSCARSGPSAAKDVVKVIQPCAELPAHVETPAWFPSTLALPDGSYASGPTQTTGGMQSVAYTVNASLPAFLRFIAGRWPKAGWQFGRRETELSDAEAEFSKQGAKANFRASSSYCSGNWTAVLFFFGSSARSVGRS